VVKNKILILLAYLRFYWYKIIKKKLIHDRFIPHNCNIWYVNVITKECGICLPQKYIKKNWRGEIIKEGKRIKRMTGCYYYKALNDKNGTRKAQAILNNFYGDVQPN
jgi:hypothetical protein